MAGLVNELLQDIGLFNTTPQTFPELFVWIVTVSVTVFIIGGFMKTFFWSCTKIGR